MVNLSVFALGACLLTLSGCLVLPPMSDILQKIRAGDRIAVLVDTAAGDIDKAKAVLSETIYQREGRLWFGEFGSGDETEPEELKAKTVAERVQGLEAAITEKSTSTGLWRYLLKALSSVPTGTNVVLVTGRNTKEEPLQRACLDKIRDKMIRVDVLWTGDSTLRMTTALQSIVSLSNGKQEKVDEILSNAVDNFESGNATGNFPNDEILTRQVGEMVNSVVEALNSSLRLERVRFPEHDESLLHKSMNSANMSSQKISRARAFIPLMVEVSSSASLECIPGAPCHIEYDVRNRLYTALQIHFAVSELRNLYQIKIEPVSLVVLPDETAKVTVTVQSMSNLPEGGDASLSFHATVHSGSPTTRKTLIQFTNKRIHDTWDPKVTYKYRGDCKGHDEPTNCEGGHWSFEATFQDEDSGLKKVLSEPYGLIFTNPFVAGTKSPVSVSYTASCCQPKIDIWAEDGNGNYVLRSLDGQNQGLKTGEIAAVVLGALLIAFIIVAIIVAVIFVRRRKQSRLIIPRYQGNN